jgi:hypothetical protein
MATVTLQKVIPTVGSGQAGPLGAIHLPRLWQKLTLGAAGLLPEDYDLCGPGFDQMTLDALALDRQKTIDFVKNNKPTYMQFEEWVVQQNGGRIDPERVRKHNEAVRAYNHDDAKAGKMRAASGIKEGTVKDAVTLNLVEDLDDFYRQVTAR